MTTTRRMGPKGSPAWLAILDAAEDILREEGYGALTSRHVAERVGIKQRLVYYYFATMDDLIVETFRRGATRELERLNDAMAAEIPLRAIWNVYVDTADTRLTSEFMALANRSDALRLEVRLHIEACRRIHVEALRKAGPTNLGGDGVGPAAAAIFAMSAALALHREAAIGVTMGHDEVMVAIADFLSERDGNQRST